MSIPLSVRIHDVWVQEALQPVLQKPLRDEVRSPCGNCPMCRPAPMRAANTATEEIKTEIKSTRTTIKPTTKLVILPEDAGREAPFHPDSKCCTYLPSLPNWLVGRLLLDDDPAVAEGKKRVQARIRAQIATTPLGVLTTPAFAQSYSATWFGRDPARLCPYAVHSEEFGGIGCSIWRHRNAVCATWFCKFDGGPERATWWKLLRDWQNEVEKGLASYCAVNMPTHPAMYGMLFDNNGKAKRLSHGEIVGLIDADGTIDPSTYRAMWGEWVGREEEYFMECAKRVQNLPFVEMLHAAGPAARAVLGQLLVAPREYPAASTLAVPLAEEGALEKPLQAATFLPLQFVAAARDDGMALSSVHSEYDAIVLDERLHHLLLHNKQTFAARDWLELLQGDADALQKLVLWGLLESPKVAEDGYVYLGSDDLPMQNDWLRVPAHIPVHSRSERTLPGHPILHIQFGALRISIDDVDLLPAAELLVSNRHGVLVEQLQQKIILRGIENNRALQKAQALAMVLQSQGAIEIVRRVSQDSPQQQPQS